MTMNMFGYVAHSAKSELEPYRLSVETCEMMIWLSSLGLGDDNVVISIDAIRWLQSITNLP